MYHKLKIHLAAGFLVGPLLSIDCSLMAADGNHDVSARQYSVSIIDDLHGLRPTSDLSEAALDLRLLYLSPAEIQDTEKQNAIVVDMRGLAKGKVGRVSAGITLPEVVQKLASQLAGIQYVCFLVRRDRVISFPFGRGSFSKIEAVGPTEIGDVLVFCAFSY